MPKTISEGDYLRQHLMTPGRRYAQPAGVRPRVARASAATRIRVRRRARRRAHRRVRG